MNEWRIYKLDRGSIRSNPRPKHDLGNWNILYCWTVLTVVTFINLSFSDIFIMVDIFFWCLRLELGLDNYQRIDPRNWSSKDIPTSWQEKLTMTIMINESDEDHIGRKNFDEREIQICAKKNYNNMNNIPKQNTWLGTKPDATTKFFSSDYK